jgi:hypothetical protein
MLNKILLDQKYDVAATLQNRIPEVFGANLSRVTDNPEFFVVLPNPFKQILDIIIIASVEILSNFLLFCDPNI